MPTEEILYTNATSDNQQFMDDKSSYEKTKKRAGLFKKIASGISGLAEGRSERKSKRKSRRSARRGKSGRSSGGIVTKINRIHKSIKGNGNPMAAFGPKMPGEVMAQHRINMMMLSGKVPTPPRKSTKFSTLIQQESQSRSMLANIAPQLISQVNAQGLAVRDAEKAEKKSTTWMWIAGASVTSLAIGAALLLKAKGSINDRIHTDYNRW